MSRLAPFLTACLLLASLLTLTPSASAATEVCLPDDEIRVYFQHAGSAANRFGVVSPSCVTIPDEVPGPATSDCAGDPGLWISWLGLVGQACVHAFPGGACVTTSLQGATFVDYVCLDDNGSGNPCLSNYSGGALTPGTSDRVCLDKNAKGEACLSNYSSAGTAVRLCAEFDDNGDACPTLYVDETRYDRTCVLDDNDPGLGCLSNYVTDGSTNVRVCADQDGDGHQCPSTYVSGERVDRTCIEDEPRSTCASNYWSYGTVRARACLDDDGRQDHPCATIHAEGQRRDRACLEPEGDVLCASNTVDNAGRITGCVDPSTDGQTGHACATVHLDSTELDRACNDPEPAMTICASDYVLGGYGADRTCVGNYPEGLCVSHVLAIAGASLEDRTCSTMDEEGNGCVSNTLYSGGSPAAQVRTCPDAAYAEGDPCFAHRVTTLAGSAEARTCQSTDPDTGQPCVRTHVFSNGNPQAAPGSCVPTTAACESHEVGAVVDGQRYCVDHPCPEPVTQPPGSVVAVCGVPVDQPDDPCPQGAAAWRLAACGVVGPLCPEGLYTLDGAGMPVAVCGQGIPYPQDPCPQGVDAWTVSACGQIGPLCPTGLYTLDAGGNPTKVCGAPIPACPGPVTFPPSDLVAVCGVPVDHPCPQGVDAWTVSACGQVGPLCPTGLYTLDAGGNPTKVCGQPMPALCEDGIGPVTPGQPSFAVCGETVPNPAAPFVPECMDGLDNDGDGRADYWPSEVPAQPGADDPDCITPFKDSESA